MTFHWGADLLEETAGLDVLGVRGIDQSIELRMVNGITTISQRGRYLSILPWALGEFFSANSGTAFEWIALTRHLRRVEFVVLAATRLDAATNRGDPTGTIGADLHAQALASLLGGQNVALPDDKGGSILGAYLSPCRALGLLKDSADGVPYKLTPRGKAIWEARNAQPGVDVIVVYKIDRLSRSLMDFAKLVEAMEAHGVTFVSVTQSFNTTTSMGRLTLNILLSFAQFEREVIGERIRDKFAASRARGMWMGGKVPLGYDVVSRKLVVNEDEARRVRRVFELFAESRRRRRRQHRAAGFGRGDRGRGHRPGTGAAAPARVGRRHLARRAGRGAGPHRG
jgi:DNA invertase Pin-like site-specific DNA recombinase